MQLITQAGLDPKLNDIRHLRADQEFWEVIGCFGLAGRRITDDVTPGMSLAFQDLMPLTSGTESRPSCNSVGRIRSADQSVRVVVGGAMPTDARRELDLALPLGG